MIGGLEDAVAQLAFHLQRDQGISSSVITLDRPFNDLGRRLPTTDVCMGIPVRRIPFIGSSRYPIAPNVLKELGNADIVHVHGIDFFFDFLAATQFLHRRPLVASTHGGFFHTDFASKAKRVWFSSITRMSAKGYARIFGSSENDAATFRQIASQQTVAIENGVNIDKWNDAAAFKPTATMIFIGRFSVNKDVPGLIQLVAALGSPWRLIVAGQPSDLSANDLRTIAKEAGSNDRVDIHVGANDAELCNLIGQSSYVASASRYEGFGLSIIEGMSAGLVPLLRPIPPFKKLVERTHCGLLVEMDDPAKAAQEVREFHATAALERRIQAISAASKYSWTGVAGQFAAEYRNIIAGSGPGDSPNHRSH